MTEPDTLMDQVQIRLDKKPGEATFHCQMNASSPEAAIQAVICQVCQIADELEMPVISILSIITTRMVGELTEEA